MTAWVVGDLDDPRATDLVVEALMAMVSHSSHINIVLFTAIKVQTKRIPSWICACSSYFAQLGRHRHPTRIDIAATAICQRKYPREQYLCGDPLREVDGRNP